MRVIHGGSGLIDMDNFFRFWAGQGGARGEDGIYSRDKLSRGTVGSS